MNIQQLKDKVDRMQSKIDAINDKKHATDCQVFLAALKSNTGLLNMGSKYISELNDLIGQIADVSRILLLSHTEKSQKLKEDKNKESDNIESGSSSVDDFLLNINDSRGNVTGITSALNIL